MPNLVIFVGFFSRIIVNRKKTALQSGGWSQGQDHQSISWYLHFNLPCLFQMVWENKIIKWCFRTQTLFYWHLWAMVNILFAIVNTTELSWQQWNSVLFCFESLYCLIFLSNLMTVIKAKKVGGGWVSSDDEFYTDARWRWWCK